MKFQTLYLMLVVVLTGSHLSWAQTYRYRNQDGRLILSDTPPTDGAEIVTTMPEGRGPSTQVTVQAHSRKALKQIKKRQVRQTVRRQNRHRRRLQKTPRPVNTHQFGLLKLGSSKAEILRALGPPLEKVKQGKKK